MNSNGMKVFNRTAFTLIAWMTGIVLVVAWRSQGNAFAICLASGLPLGVIALWVIVHLSDASRLTPQQESRLPKKPVVKKPLVAKAVTRVPLHTAMTANKESGAALRAAATQAAVQAHTAKIAEQTRLNRLQAEALKASEAAKASAAVEAAFPEQDGEQTTVSFSNFHPLDSISTNVSKKLMETAAQTGVFKESDESSFNVNFLDHMTYLYQPAQGKGRDRQTLDGSEIKKRSKSPRGDLLSTLTTDDEKVVPQLDLDFDS